jgi:hypothetical protein
MADDLARQHPGQHDVSDQFKSGANLVKALSDYKAIKDSGGDYEFGALTAKFYDLRGGEKQSWDEGVALYPKDVQKEIKRHIIHALTHKEHGQEKPIPLSISWRDPLGQKFVRCTYDPSAPSYTILISGFPMPLSTRFADRRGKY